ncbi:MAG: LptF/LptG family permease [Pirellulales bacterium]|nr:LptF/LptG family permease [Pirellulales bacterium]
MRILTRYVMFELLKVFLVSVAGMTLLFILVGVFREAYSNGLGAKQIFMLLPYVLPEALQFAVPATTLFAACSVFGRLASSNEVVAVKASGISPFALLLPAWVLAFLLSLCEVWLNDLAVSWGRDSITRLVIESVEEIAYNHLQQTRSYSSGQFSIIVNRVEGKKLIAPLIKFQSGDDELPTTIECEEATMRSDLVNRTLTITCVNSYVEMGEARTWLPGAKERVIPLNEASRKGGGTRSPSSIALRELPSETAQQVKRIDQLRQQMAVQAAFQMIGGDFSTLTGPSWDRQRQRLSDAQHWLHRLKMEPYRRWANGFTCLCFVLVGAPFAIWLRNADFLTSFFACFFPILAIYYPLMAVGVAQAKSGSFPSWGVWGGNVILIVIGYFLTRRVWRY